MMPLVHIHADESCLGNQNVDRDSPGGTAAIIETWRDDSWVRRDYWQSDPSTTNNRMALVGAAAALNFLRKPCKVLFVSDSQYLVKGMTEWIHGWKRNNWKRKAGALENAALWQDLAAAAAHHTVTWQWVRGHAGHPRNEYANYLATRAAKKQDSSDGLVDSGFEAWLEQEREKYSRYYDFNEFGGP